MIYKTCTICCESKDIDNFEFQNKKKGYRHSWCIPCRRQKTQDYRNNNREYVREWHRNWVRQHRIENPEQYKLIDLKQRCRKYGVTVEWYIEQLERQGGVCALCLKPEVSERKKGSTVRSLAIDHCHINGTARGLLCSACNQAVGKIEGSEGWIKRAVEYLKET